MRQFQSQDIKNTLLAELSWTHHLTIFSRCKTEEEREFYLRMTIKENYSVRELDRQINTSLFERVMIGNAKLSTLLREISWSHNLPAGLSYFSKNIPLFIYLCY